MWETIGSPIKPYMLIHPDLQLKPIMALYASYIDTDHSNMYYLQITYNERCMKMLSTKIPIRWQT